MEPEVQESLLERSSTSANGSHLDDINRLEVILSDFDQPYRKRIKDAVFLESKLLWRLAAPAVAVYVISYIMGLATQIFSGHLGNLELAAAFLGYNGIHDFSYGLMVCIISFYTILHVNQEIRGLNLWLGISNSKYGRKTSKL